MTRSTLAKNSYPSWGLASKLMWRNVSKLTDLCHSRWANIAAKSSLITLRRKVHLEGASSGRTSLLPDVATFNFSFHVVGNHHFKASKSCSRVLALSLNL